MKAHWLVMLVAVLVCQSGIASQAIAADKIKYGEWEVNIDMTGLPIAVPTQTQRVCLQKGKLVPGTRQQHGCQVKWTLHGHTVNWTIQCRNGTHGKGSATYHWDRLHGYNELIMPGGLMSMQSKLTGKWLAANCSAQALH